MRPARQSSGAVQARAARAQTTRALCGIAVRLTIVLEVGEARIGRRAFERAAFGAGPPSHDLLDLARERKVLSGHALGGVRREPDLEPGIGDREIGMMPRRFREMAD